MIADAGRTQIQAGSLTVCGLGPADSKHIDLVTGNKKLLWVYIYLCINNQF